MWQVFCVFGVAIGVLMAMDLNPRQRKRAALMDAIAKGDLETVNRIIGTNFNLNFNYAWQFMRLGSPVSLAFSKKDRLIADALIARGASLSPKSPGNDALLSAAVHGGNFELIDLALGSGHDIHFKPNRHSKPLATAIHHNSIPLARFLISRGAGKEDLTLGDCRWHAMRSETILLVHELGIEVPEDVLTAVQNGNWDTAPSKNA